jgi:ABC-2 type transport system ATP-binding protein
MPEEPCLYPKMKVSEQLRYFAELSGMSEESATEAAAGWLERLNLGDRADARLEELSHGNQQRVQLAAAIVHDPSSRCWTSRSAGWIRWGSSRLPNC